MQGKYQEILQRLVDDLSDLINQETDSYEEKLQALNTLISSGKTSANFVRKVNETLFAKLSDHQSKTKIVVQINAKEEEFRFLIANLKQQVMYTPYTDLDDDNEAHAQFKRGFIKTIEEGLKEIFKDKQTVRIEVPEEPELPVELVEEYFQNYMQVSTGEGQVEFSVQALEKYLWYLESQIDPENDESILRDEMRGLAESEIQRFIEPLFDEKHKSILEESIKRLQVTFGWLLSKNEDPKVASSLKRFEKEVTKKVFDLALRINTEVFPKLLEDEVDSIQTEQAEIINSLRGILKSLENERDQVFEKISFEKLREYTFFPKVLNEIPKALDYLSAKSCLSALGCDDYGAEILQEFLVKRQELAPVIARQLGTGENSYSFVKEEIESLRFSIDSEELNQMEKELILYFINSVELFYKELEESILGGLDLDFETLLVLEKTARLTVKANEEMGKTHQEELRMKKQTKQDQINNQVMNSYKLPPVISLAIAAKLMQQLDRVNSEIFVQIISEDLSTRSVDELFVSDSLDISKELEALSLQLGENNVTQAFSFLNLGKTIVENDEIKDFLKEAVKGILGTSVVLSAGLTVATLVKDLWERQQKTTEDDDKILELLTALVEKVGSQMIRQRVLQNP